MKRIALLFLLSLPLCAFAQQATVVTSCATGRTTPLNAGTQAPVMVDTTGYLCGAETAAGVVDENLKQVNGATVNVGTGAASTGTQRVTTSTDSTIATITNPVTVTDGAGALNVIVDSSALPSGAATATNQTSNNCGTSVVSSAAEGTHVLAAAASKLCALTITVGATSGYVMVFNATSAPTDGAVTPIYCAPVRSDGTSGGYSLSWSSIGPLVGSTGLSVAFSTTGCFTKTASATAAFFALVQ